jgi:maleate isomerase
VLSACVQMPSLAVLDEVSRQTQVPVLTAATATAGEVLDLLGQQAAVAPAASG